MKYVLQYRVRRPNDPQNVRWKDAQTFDSAEEANRVRADCIKYQMKGTKDWRVQPVVLPAS